MGVEGLGFVNDVGGELGMERLEDGFGEAGADVADGFEEFFCGVVASEKEGTVDGGALASAEVGAEHDEVKGVADAGEVVFFHFEPVSAAFARLVAAFVGVEHFDHKAFA